jgi:peptidoglycan/LPS O-acetylase OafA/YrhL
MKKLDALTGLRFIAAIMIVIYHLDGAFGFPKAESLSALPQAVCFFFILSGFILTYSYPNLDSLEAKKSFFIARIARIWPAHFFFFLAVSLLSFFGLIWNIGGLKSALSNIFLIHAFIPTKEMFFSYNSVSWSISVEFFFYLCFPFILHRWDSSWKWKTLSIFCIPPLFIALSAYLQIPDYSTKIGGLSNTGLLSISPFIRLPEFLIGILTAKMWIKHRKWINLHFWAWTILEGLILSLLSINLYFYENISAKIESLIPPFFVNEFHIWFFVGGGSFLSFCLIILIFAEGKGAIAKLLSTPIFVYLGEISFSIYLSHQMLYRLYLFSKDFLDVYISNALSMGLYFLAVFLTSSLVWRLIEKPMRQRMINAFKKNLETQEIPLFSKK